MKIKDITSKNIEDLKKILEEKREALRNFRFGGAGSKSRNVKKGNGLKKDIARILTVINNSKK